MTSFDRFHDMTFLRIKLTNFHLFSLTGKLYISKQNPTHNVDAIVRILKKVSYTKQTTTLKNSKIKVPFELNIWN